MEKRIKALFIIGILVLTNQIFAQNTNPEVTEVVFSISSTTVTVNYKVADAEQSTVTISMEVSSDGGTTWAYNFNSPTTATGDIGTLINAADGLTKTITWTYNGSYNPNFKIRIIANDLVIDGGPCADATITYGGQTYNTVQIGTQCWLKENLNIGTMINSTASGFQQTNNSIIEKYCYNNDEENCYTYGGLYEWTEAMQNVTTAGTQGICPTGWHIPTYAELQTLSSAVGNNGNALKAIGQGSGAGVGTNTSGFSGLLAGVRGYGSGGFDDVGYTTYFWSSTESGGNAYYMHLNYLNSDVYFYNDFKYFGFSVRCLKD